jgi:hypothetical protein
VGEAKISSKRRNDGESHMAASGTSLIFREDTVDAIVDHLPRWYRSNSTSTHGIISIPIPIYKGSGILLSPYPIRTSPR